MIAEQIQPQNTSYAASTKYYQFSTILEHVIDCFHTIVTDETNPYHPPLAWLTRKQPKPPEEELSIDLQNECSKQKLNHAAGDVPLSSSVRARLEKYPQQVREEIVSRARDGCAPLFLACKNGLTRIVKYLLEICGADIEQRGRFESLENHHVHSVTPIWVAAVSGHLDTVKLLIDRGANVNSISDTGSTPLRSACFLCKDDDGGLEEYDNLREDDYSFGGAPEEVDGGDIYIKIVHLLVESGADPKLPNYNGGTCLINALHNYHLVNYIISRRVDVNGADNQLKTGLHYAVQQNRVSVAKLLLANGANPYLRTRDGDDALRLSCIGGHEEIFHYLISNYQYDTRTLSDAYKLLGSSILEHHYDLTRVRKYWSRSIELLERSGDNRLALVCEPASLRRSDRNSCDIRRSRAFCGMVEFCSQPLMQTLTVDDFRIQSLLISERVLGASHRETIQRLLYRGTFYINSLRPIQCLDLWIYALRLRLEHESLFHFESVFAAQAITKLFLDLLGQRQQQHVRFSDVYEVGQLLVSRVEECERLLSFRPRSCIHEDIYDLILDMIVKLLLIMRCISSRCDEHRQARQLVKYLVDQNPKTANGSSLLHICVEPNMFEGEIHRSIRMACEITSSRVPQSITGERSHGDGAAPLTRCPPLPSTPLFHLVEDLIAADLDLDQINNDGLSALQVLCLASSIQVIDKAKIVGLLVTRGAHVDRRAATLEQDGRIRQTLRECGVDPFRFVTLKCLAARRVSESRLSFDKTMLASNLRESIAIH